VLEGKVIGGASGIGKAASVVFAGSGAKVVIADVSEDRGRETVDEIAKAGGARLSKG
jgi:NAD(P)-dependent dehydrogenase (short-subunit alcohol dehydrogenase family)